MHSTILCIRQTCAMNPSKNCVQITLWPKTYPPPRKPFNKVLRQTVFQRPDNPKGISHCWHCGTKLAIGHFDVDHFPVPFRDIHDQLCCGVTDPLDPSNLVPTCTTCNRSHKFEPEDKWYFCNRTQCCCIKTRFRQLFWTIILFLLGFFVGYLIS